MINKKFSRENILSTLLQSNVLNIQYQYYDIVLFYNL
jgi:hypothetical protein